MYPWCMITTLATIAVIVAEKFQANAFRAAAKVVASTSFLIAAYTLGAFESPYGMLIFAGLALSWFGDVFLLSRNKALFLSGLVAFLLAHVTYGTAFFTSGVDAKTLFAAAGILLIVAFMVLWWIWSKVPPDMKGPVLAYICVISAMVMFAAGAYGSEQRYEVLTGAILFYLSDLFVARDRFVSPGIANSVIGLPLYYSAQLFLAYSVM